MSLADAVAEVKNVDQFFDEADDHGDHCGTSGVEIGLTGIRHGAYRYLARGAYRQIPCWIA